MQDQQQAPQLRPRDCANLFSWIVIGWAMTMYVPIRRGLGKDHIGMEALVGLLWLIAWMLFTTAPYLAPLVPLYLLLVVVHRMYAFMQRRRGIFIHTYYNGEPWLAMGLFRLKDEMKAKAFVEPLLAAALGVYLLQFDEGAGLYFIGGAMALIATHQLTVKRDERMVDDVRNSMFENEWLTGHFQKPGRQGRRRF